MKRVSTLLLFIFVVIAALCGISEAANEKFIRVYRDNSYDMYVNSSSILQNKGVISVWIKVVYSDQGKSAVRNELPSKLKKSPIDYGMDYFVIDTKKGKYNAKMSSVYAGTKEVFREGSKKWLPLKDGTIAKTISVNINEILKQKNED